MEPQGPLLARGRDAEIFEHGPGQVLRRAVGGRSLEAEAAVMAHAAAHGYPVPAVHDAAGPCIVMDRVDGPTMLDELVRRPWRLRTHATTLAGLHRRLHQIPALPGIPETATGDRLVHRDLHPLNVLMAPSGPVVIDWANAAAGAGALDLALTWVIAVTAEADGPKAVRAAVGAFRRLFVRSFLRACGDDADEARRLLPAAGAQRLTDPNTRPDERLAIHRLLARAAPAHE